MVIGSETVDLVALVVTLSWSRKRAVVWARSKDMLSWQACQTACLQRLGGVPAVLRIDNVKTAIAKGEPSRRSPIVAPSVQARWATVRARWRTAHGA
jgi:hypothetical protein